MEDSARAARSRIRINRLGDQLLRQSTKGLRNSQFINSSDRDTPKASRPAPLVHKRCGTANYQEPDGNNRMRYCYECNEHFCTPVRMKVLNVGDLR